LGDISAIVPDNGSSALISLTDRYKPRLPVYEVMAQWIA